MKPLELIYNKKILLPLGVSLIFIGLLIYTINWREAIQLFELKISWRSISLFGVLALAIVWMYGMRWNWLLDGALRAKTYLVASLLCIGGNMFLPARGGDLLRVYYSYTVSEVMPVTVFSRLLIEKIVDLLTIAMVGALSAIVLSGVGSANNNYFLCAALISLSVVLAVILLIKYGRAILLRGLRRVFSFIGHSESIERNMTHLLIDIGSKLSLALTLKPVMLTILMWLAVYVPCYILIAEMVGVNLAYYEAMLVLFAAALGLMIPAAPSGVGTFHASVVSAFLFLGRSPAEGLLVGTAIHLLFLITYATPAALLFGVWSFNREALR